MSQREGRGIDWKASWEFGRQECARLRSELEVTKELLQRVTAERDQLVAAIHELTSASRSVVVEAKKELALFRRERALWRARTAERDSTQLLQ